MACIVGGGQVACAVVASLPEIWKDLGHEHGIASAHAVEAFGVGFARRQAFGVGHAFYACHACSVVKPDG